MKYNILLENESEENDDLENSELEKENIKDLDTSGLDDIDLDSLDDFDFDEIDFDEIELDDIDIDEEYVVVSTIKDEQQKVEDTLADAKEKLASSENYDWISKNFNIDKFESLVYANQQKLEELQPLLDGLKYQKERLENDTSIDKEAKKTRLKAINVKLKDLSRKFGILRRDILKYKKAITHDLPTMFEDLTGVTPLKSYNSYSPNAGSQVALRQIDLLSPIVEKILISKDSSFIARFYYLYYIRHYLNIKLEMHLNDQGLVSFMNPSDIVGNKDQLRSEFYSMIDEFIISDGNKPDAKYMILLLKKASHGVVYKVLGDSGIAIPSLDGSVTKHYFDTRLKGKKSAKQKEVSADEWVKDTIKYIVKSYELKKSKDDIGTRDQLIDITTGQDEQEIRKALSQEEASKWDKETNALIKIDAERLKKEYESEIEYVNKRSSGESSVFGGTASPEDQIKEFAPSTSDDMFEIYLRINESLKICLRTLNTDESSTDRFIEVQGKNPDRIFFYYMKSIKSDVVNITNYVKQITQEYETIEFSDKSMTDATGVKKLPDEDFYFANPRRFKDYETKKRRKQREKSEDLKAKQYNILGDRLPDDQYGKTGKSFVEILDDKIENIVQILKTSRYRKSNGTKDEIYDEILFLLNDKKSPVFNGLIDRSKDFKLLDDEVIRIKDGRNRIKDETLKFSDIIAQGVATEEVQNLQSQIEALNRKIKFDELSAYYPDIKASSGLRQHFLKNVELDKWARSNIDELAKIYYKSTKIYIDFLEDSLDMNDEESSETLSTLKSLELEDFIKYYSDISNKDNFYNIILSDEEEGDYSYSVPREKRVLINELILNDSSTIRKFVTMNLFDYYVKKVYNRMWYQLYYEIAQFFQKNYPQTNIGLGLSSPSNSEVDAWGRRSDSKPRGADLIYSMANLISNRTGVDSDFILFPDPSKNEFSKKQIDKLKKVLSGKKLDALLNLQKDQQTNTALVSLKSNVSSVSDKLIDDITKSSGRIFKVRERHLSIPSGESDSFFMTIGEDPNEVLSQVQNLSLSSDELNILDDLDFKMKNFEEVYKEDSKKAFELVVDTLDFVEEELEEEDDEDRILELNSALESLKLIKKIIESNAESSADAIDTIQKVKDLNFTPGELLVIEDVGFTLEQFEEEYKKSESKGVYYIDDTLEFISEELEEEEDSDRLTVLSKANSILTQIKSIIKDTAPKKKELSNKIEANMLISFILNCVTRLKKGQLALEDFDGNREGYLRYKFLNGTIDQDDFDNLQDYESFINDVSGFSAAQIYKMTSTIKKHLTKYVKKLSKNIEELRKRI
jgi:hypothetical protein